MSEKEAQGFTTRELLRELINKADMAGNRLTAIETKLDNGAKVMEEQGKDIKSLNSWMNGIKAGISLIGGSVGIHFFKNGGL